MVFTEFSPNILASAPEGLTVFQYQGWGVTYIRGLTVLIFGARATTTMAADMNMSRLTIWLKSAGILMIHTSWFFLSIHQIRWNHIWSTAIKIKIISFCIVSYISIHQIRWNHIWSTAIKIKIISYCIVSYIISYIISIRFVENLIIHRHFGILMSHFNSVWI